jgi:glycosyltransferase involved in cell wall biosynthesis
MMASQAPSVAVLLSTYNGAGFLEAQLDSLRAQHGVQVRLHARDDGSTDETLAVLKAHAETWPGLAAPSCGPNLGPAASFLELLRTAPDDADYYAFCDQDDVWLPGKLARAAAMLSAATGPALYCSNVRLVAADLTPIGIPRENGDTRFQHLLFENIAYGCTVVMNRAARELIVSRPPERGLIMHDWWCALVVAAVGRVIYDPEPLILYRQHGGNAVGGALSLLGHLPGLVSKFRRSPANFYPIHAQAAELARLHGRDLPLPHRNALEALIGSRTSSANRLRYALAGPVIRVRALDNLAARALIAAGWY